MEFVDRPTLADRQKRIGDISTALFIMSESTLVSTPTIVGPPADTTPPKWRYLAWSALAVAIAAAAAAGIVWRLTRPDAPRVSRFDITTSGASALAMFVNSPHLAITRDASKVVYVGGSAGAGSSLFVRHIDRLEPVLLTDRAGVPFVSPDGEWVGYANANTLRKVAITGGPSLEIAKIDGGSRGAAWGADDTIVFATNRIDTGLYRVSAAGGTPVMLTRPDKGTDHLRPWFLPRRRIVLFTISPESTAERRYLPSGHLVYLAAWRNRFPPRRAHISILESPRTARVWRWTCVSRTTTSGCGISGTATPSA
jgi:hypothetical protein